ncbi:MAG: META domain-containing protein [Micromonosporaceae bacterium]|nr:META domain-containing protein [Micromonosporaceae bacterium]
MRSRPTAMKPILALPLSLLLAAGAAGCGKGSGAGDDPGAGKNTGAGTPVGRTFLSDSVTDKGEPRPLVAGSQIRLEFKRGWIGAHAGCNSFSGDAEFDGDRLVVTGLGGTEMACEQNLMKQDEWLTGLLTDKPTWRLDGDTLILTRGETRIKLTDRRVADPDRPVQDTRWVVESILDGNTAASVPVGATAHLTFGDDAKVRGDTGCNQFSATVAVTKSTIAFSNLVATKKACAGGPGELEKTVLEVLRGTVSYEIEADQLTLTAKSGKGLELKAK